MQQEECDRQSCSQDNLNQSNTRISLTPSSLISPKNHRHMEKLSEYGRSTFIQRRSALYGGKDTINDANPQTPDSTTVMNEPISPFNEWKVRERKKIKRRKEQTICLETAIVVVMVSSLLLFVSIMYFMKIEDEAPSSNIYKPLHYSQDSNLKITSDNMDDTKLKKPMEYSKPRLLFYIDGSPHGTYKTITNIIKDKHLNERNDILNTTEKDNIRTSHFIPDPMLKVSSGEECTPQRSRQPDEENNCVPMHQWQIDNKPTCNSLHEIDIAWEQKYDDDEGEQILSLLGKGWFRLAWKIEQRNIYDDEDMEENYILKTLRIDRDFHSEYYELHRKDAMAMEHLTHSLFVLDVYSFCGQSAVNEIAFDSIEKVAMRMRDKNKLNLVKLRLAAEVALGVADIHEGSGEEGPLQDQPSMVHYDLNPRNVAVTSSGHVKINDFNVAEFLKWDKVEQKICKFKGRFYEPWWRAPEEVVKHEEGEGPTLLDEKVDVYSLCNVLFRIMTGRAPRGKSIPSRVDAMRDEVSKGIPPALPRLYLTTEDEALIAIRKSMMTCYSLKPEDRTTAREIGDYLYDKFVQISQKKKGKKVKLIIKK